jgi:ribosome-interacting GTPase 1
MPANLTPAYKSAEQAYRRARDPQERLTLLREMLRVIPKHKGTDHLQADIKSRIKQLTEDLGSGRKTGARGGPPTVIRPEGAAQVALVGPPNSGKSALHARLTGSHVASEPYPFATQYPQPGMFPLDDIAIQLVDLPSIAPTHPIPWMGNALQQADGCLLVVDLESPGCVERVIDLHDILRERKVELTPRWPIDPGGVGSDPDDPFVIYLPTLLVANKADLLPDPTEELKVLEELAGVAYPFMAISAETGEGLDRLGTWLFNALGIVRVYSKVPGEPPDDGPPYTARQGDTVADIAQLVHRDIASKLKYARVWGEGSFDGQQVGREHVVRDGDILELHF